MSAKAASGRKHVVLTLAGATAFAGLLSPHPDGTGAVDMEGKIPAGYRDWRLISVAHDGGSRNDLRAVLGNDVAIKAYRDRKLPFPDGTIIARLAWRYLPSEENNKVFGRTQSFVAGPPANGVQFMVKDQRIYSSTGGWGFIQFNDGKPDSEAAGGACFACPSRHEISFSPVRTVNLACGAWRDDSSHTRDRSRRLAISEKATRPGRPLRDSTTTHLFLAANAVPGSAVQQNGAAFSTPLSAVKSWLSPVLLS